MGKSLFAGIVGFILGVFSLALAVIFGREKMESKQREIEDDTDDTEIQ